eukprot:jgi/Mesvir1/16919/Mv25575-RA.1
MPRFNHKPARKPTKWRLEATLSRRDVFESPTWHRRYFWKGMPRLHSGFLPVVIGLFLLVGYYPVSLLLPSRLPGLPSRDAHGATLPVPVDDSAPCPQVDDGVGSVSAPDNAYKADVPVYRQDELHGPIEVQENSLFKSDQDVQAWHPLYSRSDYHEHFRLPVVAKACAYASIAASRRDAIESVALFKQLHSLHMRSCTCVLLLPRQSLKEVWHHERVEKLARRCDFLPWQDIICPLQGWLDFLDVHVVLADVPFDIKDVEDSTLQRMLLRSLYPVITLLKGVILGLTEYAKVVYLDSDMLILSDFSEVVDAAMGTAASGLIYGTPLNAGIFVAQPHAGVMKIFIDIFKTAKYTRYGFNNAWEKEGQDWTFPGSFSDQGSLFYLFKFILKSGVWLDPFLYGYPACVTQLPPPQFLYPKVVHFKGRCKRMPVSEVAQHMKRTAMGGKKHLALHWLRAWHNWTNEVVESSLFEETMSACKPTNFTLVCRA